MKNHRTLLSIVPTTKEVIVRTAPILRFIVKDFRLAKATVDPENANHLASMGAPQAAIDLAYARRNEAARILAMAELDLRKSFIPALEAWLQKSPEEGSSPDKWFLWHSLTLRIETLEEMLGLEKVSVALVVRLDVWWSKYGKR